MRHHAYGKQLHGIESMLRPVGSCALCFLPFARFLGELELGRGSVRRSPVPAKGSKEPIMLAPTRMLSNSYSSTETLLTMDPLGLLRRTFGFMGATSCAAAVLGHLPLRYV